MSWDGEAYFPAVNLSSIHLAMSLAVQFTIHSASRWSNADAWTAECKEKLPCRALMYLSIVTRSDIAYGISVCSGTSHWQAPYITLH